MSTRRQARECSLQMLYTVDNCNMPIEAVYQCFDEYFPQGEPYRVFAVRIFKGVCDKRNKIDSLYSQICKKLGTGQNGRRGQKHYQACRLWNYRYAGNPRQCDNRRSGWNIKKIFHKRFKQIRQRHFGQTKSRQTKIKINPSRTFQ